MQLLKQIKRLFSRDEPRVQGQQASAPSLAMIREEIARLEEAVRLEQIAQQQRPKRTQEDVERIIRRDFPLERFESIVSTLNAYGSRAGKLDSTRVRLAILKLANGDWSKVAPWMEEALVDFRDVLSGAEYPSYFDNLKKHIRTEQLSTEEQKRISTSDRNQYDEWLQK